MMSVTRTPTRPPPPNCSTSLPSNVTGSEFNWTDADLWRENEAFARTVVPAMLFLAVVMVAGAVGNSLVVYVYTVRFRVATQHFLIVCLACSDLLICLLAMPTEIADLRFHYTFASEHACRLLRFGTMFCAIASILVLVVIAVDRYRRVCLPLKRQMALREARWGAALSVLAALASSWPLLVLTGLRTAETPLPGLYGRDCSFADEYKHTKYPLAFNITLGAGFVALAIVLAGLYFQIWREVRRHRAKRNAGRMAFGSVSSQSWGSSTKSSVVSGGSGRSGFREPGRTNYGFETDSPVSERKASGDSERSGSNALPQDAQFPLLARASRDARFPGNRASRDAPADLKDHVFRDASANSKGNGDRAHSLLIPVPSVPVWNDGDSATRRFSALSENSGQRGVCTEYGEVYGRQSDAIFTETNGAVLCRRTSNKGHAQENGNPVRNDITTDVNGNGNKDGTADVKTSGNYQCATCATYTATNTTTATTTATATRAVTTKDSPAKCTTGGEDFAEAGLYRTGDALCSADLDTFEARIPKTSGPSVRTPRTRGDKYSDIGTGSDVNMRELWEAEKQLPEIVTISGSIVGSFGARETFKSANTNLLADNEASFVTTVTKKASLSANTNTVTQEALFSANTNISTNNVEASLVTTVTKGVSLAANTNIVTQENSLSSKKNIVTQGNSLPANPNTVTKENSLSANTDTMAKEAVLSSNMDEVAQEISLAEEDKYEHKPHSFSVTSVTHTKLSRKKWARTGDRYSDKRTSCTDSERNESPRILHKGKQSDPWGRTVDKTTVVAFAVTLVFVISFLPYLTIMFVRAVIEDFDYMLHTSVQLNLYNIFIRFYFLNSAANPVIYSVLNAKFRAECLVLCRRIFCFPCRARSRPKAQNQNILP